MGSLTCYDEGKHAAEITIVNIFKSYTPHMPHAAMRVVPKATNPGMDHSMPHYIGALTRCVSALGLPEHWPRR